MWGDPIWQHGAMAKHDVALTIPSGIEIGSRDLTLVVKADSTPLGTVTISKGSIDWKPSPNKKAHFQLTWEQFADLMTAMGTRRG